MPSPQKNASRVSSTFADLGLGAGYHFGQSNEDKRLTHTSNSDRRANDSYNQTTHTADLNVHQPGNNAERRHEETDMDSVSVSNHSLGRRGKFVVFYNKIRRDNCIYNTP